MNNQTVFPFGAPNLACPPTKSVEAADVFLVGVYPSALHVWWQAPQWYTPAPAASGILGSVAVDREPAVFWRGGKRDRDRHVQAWKSRIGFREGNEPVEWGTIKASGNNGVSGRNVERLKLKPPAVPWTKVYATDIVNTYHVKRDDPDDQGPRVDLRRPGPPLPGPCGRPFGSSADRPPRSRVLGTAAARSA